MQYNHVCLESLGYTLPEEVVSSAAIEERLAPLYERLRLPQGRLELMTGIRERRFWKRGTLPSEKSVVSAQRAIEAAGFDRSNIGVLIHGSVCRDHLEPATASRVHHELGLSPECLIYDVSNACLGLLNGVLQIANMIELGQVRAGLVVGTEGSRQLVETTIDALNRDETLSRKAIKSAVASLTIGSGSCAILLCDRELSSAGSSLSAATIRANTQHHRLCHSGQDEAVADGMSPLMQTDSERLMAEGIATGVETFQSFLSEAEWNREQLNKTVCHQVGAGHRKQMCESLGIELANDFATLQWLGNTGSVALPITLARAAEEGFLKPDDNVGLLGIGSGINCIMLAVQWQNAFVAGNSPAASENLVEASALAGHNS